MRNENETLQASQAEAIRGEIARMRESVEIARSDIRRTKHDIQQYQDDHESHVRRTRVLWVLVILLVAGIAGVSYYYGPSLLSDQQGQGLLAAKMPVMQSTLDNIAARAAATEQQISEWAKDRAGLSDRMSKVEQTVGSNLKTVRNEERLMAQQIKSETGQGVQTLQNRVTGVESREREHIEEVARLRNELTGVRQELASVREENVRQANQLSGQIEQVHQSTRNDLSGLDRRIRSNSTAVSSLGYQVDRKRIDFELQKGRTQQIAEGVYVTVKDTNVGRQQVDGWIQIARDGRFVWMRDQSAQNPIDFSSRADARADQLVFTQVGRNTASGYILVPITGGSAADATN